MSTLLVSSTEEGTGKTAITIALAKLAQERGDRVSYMKPKGTRLESAVGKTRDQDPMLAREVLGLDAQMHTLEPVVYSPTFVTEAIRGREDLDALRGRVTEAFERLASETELVFLEGGGRLSIGEIVGLTDVDVAELLDAQVLLVSRYDQMGDVDELLAGANAFDDRLLGVLFNDVASPGVDELTEDVMPFLDGREVDSVGVVPRDERLAGVTVEELASSIGAELLTSGGANRRVERFTVGAMGSEAALRQFRRTRNAAVITGGDRSDVQTVALQASGVSCLVLTGGYRPSSAVLGEAEDRGVPVLLVGADTRTTIDRTESRLRSGRAQRPETVERMADILDASIDVDELLGRLG